jgi:hypothetical protein
MRSTPASRRRPRAGVSRLPDFVYARFWLHCAHLFARIDELTGDVQPRVVLAGIRVGVLGPAILSSHYRDPKRLSVMYFFDERKFRTAATR